MRPAALDPTRDRSSPEESRPDASLQYIHVGDGQEGPGGTGIIQENVPLRIRGDEPTLPFQAGTGPETDPRCSETRLLEEEPNPQGQDQGVPPENGSRNPPDHHRPGQGEAAQWPNPAAASCQNGNRGLEEEGIPLQVGADPQNDTPLRGNASGKGLVSTPAPEGAPGPAPPLPPRSPANSRA